VVSHLMSSNHTRRAILGLFCIVVDLYALLMIILLHWQPGLMASWGGGEWERLWSIYLGRKICACAR